MNQPCYCKTYLKDPELCDLVRDGIPICREECARKYDATQAATIGQADLSHVNGGSHA